MVSLFEEHIFNFLSKTIQNRSPNPSTPSKEKEKRRFDHTGHENDE